MAIWDAGWPFLEMLLGRIWPSLEVLLCRTFRLEPE